MYLYENRFEVRFAETSAEIKRSQELRYKVFIDEMGGHSCQRNSEPFLEKDEFDDQCRHLILIDHEKNEKKVTQKIIGVIRLILGSKAKLGLGFCSSREYDLKLLVSSGQKCLELGRTCIDKSYRNGLALHYLWKGLGSYTKANGVSFMFGLASFPGNDVKKISMALSFINEKYLVPTEIRPKALKNGFIDMAIIPRDKIDKLEALRQMPSLLKGYLRLGARVGEGAFIDRELNTIDVCIVIDLNQMLDKYKDYYGKS